MQGLPNLDLTTLAVGSRELIIMSIILVLVYMLWQLIKMLRLTLGLGQNRKREGGFLDGDIDWAVEDKNFRTSGQGGALKALAAQRDVHLRPLVPVDNPPEFLRPGSAPEPAGRRSATEARADSPLDAARRGWQGQPAARNAGSATPGRRDFGQETFLRGVENELEQIRGEMQGVRKDIDILRREWDSEMQQMRMTTTTSPIYSDAMQLAAQGFDVAAIAERCDIPPGEASLVVALVGKKRQRA